MPDVGVHQHSQTCAGCGAERPVTSRNTFGAPLCQVCHNRQPLYNRFPTRQDLIEAVFIDRLETLVTLAERSVLLTR